VKAGRSLTELAAELERQVNTRRDFLAPTEQIVMRPEPMRLALNGTGEFNINRLGHEQIAGHVEIPQRYYDRMLEQAPSLLADNVNTWLHRAIPVDDVADAVANRARQLEAVHGRQANFRRLAPKPVDTRRMVRTLDNNVRAFLSPRYRPLDNHDLASVVLPELTERGCVVESAELTERRFYVKATLPGLELPVPGSRRVGDMVRMMLTISNSEVGSGALRIEPSAFFLVCLNGAIFETSLKRYHVGRVAELEAEVREILTDETRAADDKAMWLKVRDVVRSAFDRDFFAAQVKRLGDSTQDRIESTNVESIVDVAVETLSLSPSLKGSILKNFISPPEGGPADFSRYGLLNAITATANTVEDYEVATALEHAGGKVLELPKVAWKKIAEAA
jgi:hypothetical protein